LQCLDPGRFSGAAARSGGAARLGSRRALLETADELDKVYQKHAHKIRMLGLNELYDGAQSVRATPSLD
jgi:hypothetical protein